MNSQAAAPQAIAVSVIVPVYNVEAWVGDCLQSILDQDFSSPFEIIVVDDCSTDASRQVCREYQTIHPQRIVLIECNENGGVSRARNLGLESMRGDYFTFVDPDDLLPREALENLYQSAQRSQASIVKGNNSIFSTSSEKAARYNVTRETLISDDDVLTVLYQHNQVRGHTWGKLFRSDPLRQCHFVPGLRMVEDLLYCCETFAQADTLLLIDKPVYRYRNRATGAKGIKYENGSYLQWLDTVEKTGHFARSRGQLRAHRNLLVRTMAQLARECRDLPPELAQTVLPTIRDRRENWDINMRAILFGHRLGLHALSHYVKMLIAIGQIERRIRESTP